MKTLTKRDYIWLSIGMIVIIVMAGYILINKDNIFKTITVITYPDGCVEKYEGTNLTTSICENGRLIAEKQKEQTYNYMPQWNMTK